MENFQENILKKDKTIQEYVRLLKLTKQEYQILFQENKKLKENINSIEKGKNYLKNNIKRQYKVERDSEVEEGEENEVESESKETGDEGAKKQKTFVARKIKVEIKEEAKLKPKKKKRKTRFLNT